MPANRYAIDVSNHSGPPPAGWGDSIRAAGWSLLIVSMYDGGIARAQIDEAQRAGIDVDIYLYMRSQEDPAAQVNEAVDKLEGRQVGRIWIDMEGEPGYHPVNNRYPQIWDQFDMPGRKAFIGAALQAGVARGLRVGMYTSAHWWRRWMADTTDFSWTVLWLATNDGVPDLSFSPFGGWDRCEMEQYAFDKVVAGVNCDLNVLGVYDTPAPEPPAPPQVSKLSQDLYALVGAQKNIITALEIIAREHERD